MNTLQRLILSVVPRSWAAEMEAHSRQWKMRCKTCGHERSYWDLGGIRWRAYGNSHRPMRCPPCGRITWHETVRRAQ